jgi:hypothetical protein
MGDNSSNYLDLASGPYLNGRVAKPKNPPLGGLFEEGRKKEEEYLVVAVSSDSRLRDLR